MSETRHPSAAGWSLPSPERAPLAAGLTRVNLRALAARPGRFEHHLLVVARVGEAQLELVTASEPLAFAHQNISDEYALALPTGDAMVDGFPLRTFLSDVATGADVGRIRHRVDQLVLHPHGFLHWPGRLRAPYEPMAFPPGARRAGLSLVFCASRPIAPAERPLFVSAGLEAEAKPYRDEPVPFLLADLSREPSRELGRVGSVRMELLVQPGRIAPPRGAYVVVLSGGGDHAPGDLVFLPPGTALAAGGIERALLFASDDAPAAPPPLSWRELPPAPIAPFEEATRGALPLHIHGLHVEERDARLVRMRIGAHAASVPRHWLARMLFRLALHGYRLGYVETYEGFYCDDRDGYRLGLRGGSAIALSADDHARAVDALYRAVAPEGYIERI